MDVSFITDLVQLRTGLFVVSANIRTRERAGLPLHLVDQTGTIVRSFGASDRTVRLLTSDDDLRLQRRLALGVDGTVLSVRAGSYVIERWSPAGERLGEWDVAPDWFSPKDRFVAMSHSEPPPPKVVGIQEDVVGRVWTILLRPDQNWRRGVEPGRKPPEVAHVLAMGAYVDAQIEVFDRRTMTRLASLRLDSPLGQFVAPGLAASLEATTDDNPVIRLWRMRVQAP
jgi:hypothetical protein